MTLSEFKESLKQPDAPANVSPLLRALWYDAKGDWHASHNVAQDVNTEDGSWVHAYLHRKEGDNGNAAYWYHRAKRPVCSTSLQEEWESITLALLTQ